MYEIADTLTQMDYPVSASSWGKSWPTTGSPKKTADTSAPFSATARQEEIEILDGACQPRPRVITRHDIDHDVTALLKRGLTTTSAGGWFFIPYLCNWAPLTSVASLGPPKSTGLPKERLALGCVFESIFGYTAGIRPSIRSACRLWPLAGLPFLPSPATQYWYILFHRLREIGLNLWPSTCDRVHWRDMTERDQTCAQRSLANHKDFSRDTRLEEPYWVAGDGEKAVQREGQSRHG